MLLIHCLLLLTLLVGVLFLVAVFTFFLVLQSSRWGRGTWCFYLFFLFFLDCFPDVLVYLVYLLTSPL